MTRRELSDISVCPQPNSTKCVEHDSACQLDRIGARLCGSGRQMLPKYDLVLMLIVDALRFDFASELPSISEARKSRSNHTRLFQFVADAPTTTMQRLKGLTTGGLPTFVDIGRSFDAGIDLQEDNWLHQVVNHHISYLLALYVVHHDVIASHAVARALRSLAAIPAGGTQRA